MAVKQYKFRECFKNFVLWNELCFVMFNTHLFRTARWELRLCKCLKIFRRFAVAIGAGFVRGNGVHHLAIINYERQPNVKNEKQPDIFDY